MSLVVPLALCHSLNQGCKRFIKRFHTSFVSKITVLYFTLIDYVVNYVYFFLTFNLITKRVVVVVVVVLPFRREFPFLQITHRKVAHAFKLLTALKP